jgi:hypothetical protein
VSNEQQRDITQRDPRFPSHALVEIRKFKHLPFFIESAVLLDISLSGFKVEFTGEVTARPGNQYWLNVPLTPLGIYAPARLLVKGECRWFDDNRFRIGGIFMELSDTEKMIIDQIVDTLKKRGVIAQ